MAPTVRLQSAFYLDPSLDFHCIRQVQKTMVWHDHDFFEIAVILSGRGRHKTLREKSEIGPGSALFLNAGEAHAYEFDEPIELVNLLLGPTFLARVSSLLPEGAWLVSSHLRAFAEGRWGGCAEAKASPHRLPALRRAVEALVEAHKARKAISSNLVRVRFLEVAWHLSQCFPEPGNEADLPEPTEGDALSLLVEEIRKRFAEPLDLSAWAERHGLSPSRLSKGFKKKCGYSPVEYLTEVRIEAACRLLKRSDVDLDEVGRRSGFPTVSSFYKQFKKTTGMTPLAYRVIRGAGEKVL